jgi:hypothetical protein
VFLVDRPSPGVKLVDFGISKLRGEGDLRLTATNALMGTPFYMPPEQVRGARDVGPAADLYAMGAVLYHALAGRVPLGGTSYGEILAKVLEDEPEPLADLRPDAPPALTALVHALLAKRPAERPPSAAAVRARLAEILAGLPADVDVATAGTLPAAPASPASARAPTAPAPGAPVASAAHRATPRARLVAATVALVAAAGIVAAFVLYPRVAPRPSQAGAAAADGGSPVAAPVAVVPRADAGPAAALVGPASGPAVAPEPERRKAPPAAVRDVAISFTLRPPQATLQVAGRPVRCGGGRCSVARPAGSSVKVVVAAKGHARVERTVVFDRARAEVIELPTLRAPVVDDEVDRSLPDLQGTDTRPPR